MSFRFNPPSIHIPPQQRVRSDFIRLRVIDHRSSLALDESRRIFECATEVAQTFRFSTRAFTFVEAIELHFMDQGVSLIIYTQIPDRLRHADSFSGESILVRFSRMISYFDVIDDRKRLWEKLRSTLAECLLHEMDECIYEGDHRPFDPHRNDGF